MSSLAVMNRSSPWDLRRDQASNFDFIRLLASLSVVYVHSITSLRGTELPIEESDFLCYVTRGNFYLGELAVNCFFTLSGFLITQSWLSSKSTWDYLVRRVLRIYPAFLATVLFCTFLIGPIASDSGWGLVGLIDWNMWLDGAIRLNLVLPPLFTENPQPNHSNVSLWTIPYEFDCYLCVAALGIAGLFKYRLGILCMWLLLYVWHILSPIEAWPRFLCYFFAGTLFFLYRESIPRRGRVVVCMIAAIVCITLLVPSWLRAIVPIGGTYILFATAFESWGFHRLREHVGDLSYGIYLFAFPIQQLLAQNWHEHLNPTTMFLIAGATSCLLAYLSWHLIERPFLALSSAGKSSKTAGSRSPVSKGCMLVIAAFGLIAIAHTIGGSKIDKLWQLVFHAGLSPIIVCAVDASLVAWLIWCVIILSTPAAAHSLAKRLLAQAPFWAWIGFLAVQSLASIVRSLAS